MSTRPATIGPDETAQSLLAAGPEEAMRLALRARDEATHPARVAFWSDVAALLRLETQSDEPSEEQATPITQTFLLIRSARHGEQTPVISQDKEKLVALAVAFLGDHNPVDGCSMPRQISDVGGEWRGHRSSSFGVRSAKIVVVESV